MKKSLVVALLVVAALFGCGKNKDQASDGENVVGSISAVKNMANESQKIADNTDALQKASPLSSAQMKSVIPESIGGLPRKELMVGNPAVPGMQTAMAQYSGTDQQGSIDLMITDGAGETAGAMVASVRMSIAADMQVINEMGYQKISQIDGVKGIEEQRMDKVSHIIEFSELTLLVNNRFVVSFTGKNMSMDVLKHAIQTSTVISALQKLS